MTDFIQHLRIDLLGEGLPPTWRRIALDVEASFWELHVAIQDAMGWEDRHLHEFRVVGSNLAFGPPDVHAPGPSRLAASWEHRASDHLSLQNPVAIYEYDLGDGWMHALTLEAVAPAGKGKYPRCLEGRGKCPPEDVGGVPGYLHFLEAVRDAGHPQHASMVEWVGGRFDAEEFDAGRVKFVDPAERLKGLRGR